MPSRVARLRLAQAVESQFDTSVVAAFEAILAGASEGYRMAADPEFALTSGSLGKPDQVSDDQTPLNQGTPVKQDEQLGRSARVSALA